MRLPIYLSGHPSHINNKERRDSIELQFHWWCGACTHVQYRIYTRLIAFMPAPPSLPVVPQRRPRGALRLRRHGAPRQRPLQALHHAPELEGRQGAVPVRGSKGGQDTCIGLYVVGTAREKKVTTMTFNQWPFLS